MPNYMQMMSSQIGFMDGMRGSVRWISSHICKCARPTYAFLRISDRQPYGRLASVPQIVQYYSSGEPESIQTPFEMLPGKLEWWDGGGQTKPI